MNVSEDSHDSNTATTINDLLLYSQVMSAMNSARIIRVLTDNRNYNNTERQVIVNSLNNLVLCSYKPLDKNSKYNLKEFIEAHRQDIKNDKARERLIIQLDEIENKHSETLEKLRVLRNQYIAHLDSTDIDNFLKHETDLKNVQDMLIDISKYINELPWVGKEVIGGFLEYDQIKKDLRA